VVVSVTGGELVVQTLRSLGVRHVFGIPGGQTLAVLDAIVDAPGITFVTTRHEGAAAAMADAYGRLTRTPGVCLATTGPGATNLLTGVGGALRDSSPVIVLTCNNNSVDLGKDDAQNADHCAIFSPLVKKSRLVVRPEAVPQAMEEAWLCAMSGNPGPVHVDLSRDAVEGACEAPAPLPAVHPALEWVHQRPRPDAGALVQVADRLRSASRPVLWLGSGTIRSEAGPTALALAEALSMPVLTTFNGIGAVPTTHRLVFGAHSRMGTALSHRVLSESDLVLAVGNGLNAVSTSRWNLALPEVVQVDIDPLSVGRYYSAKTTGLIGDARATLEELQSMVAAGRSSAAQAAAAQGRSGWVRELAAARQSWWADAATDLAASGRGLLPPEVLIRLRQVSPDETLLIPDAGNPGVWSYLWEVREIGAYMKPVGFGNMGFAVPAAIAAAVRDPCRPVLALVGDGSLGMTLAELETLARVGGRVCVVVLNDSGYGNIRQEQALQGRRPIGVDYRDCDYAAAARGLGVRAARVTTLEELQEGVKEALCGSGGPVLFDVPIDQSVNAWTFPAFQPPSAVKQGEA
jgi:acetolactate synthase-1/2/3 large subunit